LTLIEAIGNQQADAGAKCNARARNQCDLGDSKSFFLHGGFAFACRVPLGVLAIGLSLAPSKLMKLSALLLLAFSLTACSQSDKEHARAESDRAREQARETAEQLKHDSREALHEVEGDARKANRELNQSFARTREKTRRALDQTDQPDQTSH
jgi:hypothetical protein